MKRWFRGAVVASISWGIARPLRYAALSEAIAVVREVVLESWRCTTTRSQRAAP